MESAPGQSGRGSEPAGDRLSRLSLASLRINESLDVDTALRAVMDGARSLTRATHAVITTLDDYGRIEDHLVLGLNRGDVERLWQAPQGQRFFDSWFRRLPVTGWWRKQVPGGTPVEVASGGTSCF